MGKKNITSGVKNVNIPSWSEDYYKTPLSGSDWKSQISGDWKPYQPTQATTGWSIDQGVKQTPYSPMQGDVMRTMAERMRGEAYTPEGKQKIIGGAMAPIHEMAAQMKQGATEDAYARGLGQSGVLSRSKGEIDRSTMARMAEVTGDVERWATENASKDAFAAIAAFQQGHASEQEVNLSIERMRLENDQFNAELAQKHEELKRLTNLDERDMELALAELEQAAYKTDVDRELAEMKIKNQFNLDQAQLELFKEVAIMEGKQANADWWVDLINSIFGDVSIGL